MVKNEEKYLDKTLYSLQNLMNDIDSELIILDTGSTDKTIDIAKKYIYKLCKWWVDFNIRCRWRINKLWKIEGIFWIWFTL